MKTGFRAAFAGLVLSGTTFLPPALAALNFTIVQQQANDDLLLQLSAPAGEHLRLEASTDLLTWTPLATLRSSTGLVNHTDSAAAYFSQRFYRATELTGTNILTGDHLATNDGEVTIHPVDHASFVMGWNGKMIYNDPVGAATLYQGFAKADLILVSHVHGDHYSNLTLEAVRDPNTQIIAPQSVFTNMTAALKAVTTVLANGASTTVMGLTVDAVPAYNSNHPQGQGNGYVVTIGGKRLYMSGDTGDTPQMRALANIDVAFVCMNVPFTMSVAQASSAVRAFRPRVIYPYHYRNQDSTFANLNTFKQQIGTDLGIEVRQRVWYAGTGNLLRPSATAAGASSRPRTGKRTLR